MKKLLLLLIAGVATPLIALENPDLKIDAGFGQSSFNNWQSGGQNSTAYNVKVRGEAGSTFKHANLQQNFKIAYGRLNQDGTDVKTEDELKYTQLWTIKHFTQWKPFAGLDVLTQLDEGFTDSTTDASSFAFDPLFLTESLGAFKQLNEKVSAQFGIAAKQTIVNKTTIVDSISEVGSEAKFTYKDTWAESFDVKSDLKLFYSASQLEDTDVNFNFLISTAITKHINWIYEFNLLYDTDISDESQTRQNNRLGFSIDLI